MATIGTQYREAKAIRMWLEQLEKRVGQVAKRERAELRRRLERESQENSRRIVEAARVTGAHIDSIWVDRPAAEGA